MAEAAAKLDSVVPCPPFQLYGRWNALLAIPSDGTKSLWTWAHDGDFFPESILDYVEVLRSSVVEGDRDLGCPRDPVRIDVDLTQDCNAHCLFCFSARYRTRLTTAPRIRLSDLERWLAELGRRARTKTIRLCGGGEPFAHPEIDGVLPLAHRYGLLQSVITNFDLVDEARCRAIFEHVDHFRWSVDAVSDTTRAVIHRPGPGANCLQRSFELVRQLVEWRRRERGAERRPMIWATFMLLPQNVPEMVEFASIMKEIGVDSVSFRPVKYPVHVTWSPLERARLRAGLDEVARLDAPPHFRVFAPRPTWSDATILLPSSHFADCLSRKLRTVVEPTEEGPTFQTCGLMRGSGCHPGHRLESDDAFASAWARVAKRRIPRVAPIECRRCIDISMNRTLTFVLDMLKGDPSARFQRALAPSNASEVSRLTLVDSWPNDVDAACQTANPAPYPPVCVTQVSGAATNLWADS